jgi:hypothetical protein
VLFRGLLIDATEQANQTACQDSAGSLAGQEAPELLTPHRTDAGHAASTRAMPVSPADYESLDVSSLGTVGAFIMTGSAHVMITRDPLSRF